MGLGLGQTPGPVKTGLMRRAGSFHLPLPLSELWERDPGKPPPVTEQHRSVLSLQVHGRRPDKEGGCCSLRPGQEGTGFNP
ncbi:hypothetical protein AAFF_G00268630 [Aldrovandia affinis]|uniref:Uncharacterized protein n=1 Tax=Aldrovandia affinis TaxID=143900 RepID=A0AAD7WTL4_9TELE|nr:hypothetical protein AAFF_G00268630 [Aldrovandia affinis]